MPVSTSSSRIGLISLGCAKTLVDSEELIRQLEFNGFRVVFEPTGVSGLDTIIINTCGFISDAKEESIDTILKYALAKQQGKIRQLILMGCLTQRYRHELRYDIPEADGIFGVDELPEIVRFLKGTFQSGLIPSRTLTTPSHYAYLKIAEGCDRTCSFCAIPAIRGKHRSRPIGNILSEALVLRQLGVKELILIAQDTTYYGIDLYGKRELATLMRRLAETSGMDWIRLHYTYPHAFPGEILDVINEFPAICKYIDIPLQHISDPILKSMRRGIGKKETRQLVDTIRNTIPDVTIRTTFITGYPGEQETHFRELCQFITEMEFDRVGFFRYSHEENTPAFTLRDSVSGKVKKARQDELQLIQESISLKKNREKIGCRLSVLVDRLEGDYYIARTEGDSPDVDNEVHIPVSNQSVVPGTFVRVLITDAGPFELFAQPCV